MLLNLLLIIVTIVASRIVGYRIAHRFPQFDMSQPRGKNLMWLALLGEIVAWGLGWFPVTLVLFFFVALPMFINHKLREDAENRDGSRRKAKQPPHW